MLAAVWRIYNTLPIGWCVSAGKTRTKDKYRIVYTELQKVELEKEFLFNQYITIQRKAELAVTIGLSDRQVKIWFQNRRAKERKHKRKREEVSGSTTSALGRGGGNMQSAVRASGVNDTSRLRAQLQLHQQQRYSDVIKMENIGSEVMTSSTTDQRSSVYSLWNTYARIVMSLNLGLFNMV
jgi:Homeodomain